jgi:hypothetical protein
MKFGGLFCFGIRVATWYCGTYQSRGHAALAKSHSDEDRGGRGTESRSVAGKAAIELWAECRRQKRAGRRLRLELAGVRFIDPAGVLKLKRLTRQGVEVVNASLLVSALLSDEA